MSRATPAWIVVAATLAAYALAGGTAFQYDDFRVIVIERGVQSLDGWLASMPGMRPLTKASYLANWLVSPSPGSFAWTGVAIHLACALVLVALARRWAQALAPSCPRPGFAALACALVFALHPAQTEAVVYIAGRSTALSSLATLAGLYAWERARGGDRVWLAATIGALVAALAAREAAWTLPFAVVLVEVARGSAWRAAFARTAPRWIALGALVALGAAIAANRALFASSLAIRAPADNLVAQADAIVYLVSHPLATLRLNFDPDLAARTTIDAAWFAKVAAILAVVALGAAQLRRRPWLAFAILWFALMLLPTHGPLARLELANDRQLHLALAGPAFALGVALASARAPAIAAAALGALALVLGIATFVRVTDYSSEARLWGATVRAAPENARAWNNYGHALMLDGDRDGARRAFERALAIDPAHRRARGNLDTLDGVLPSGQVPRGAAGE